jgi:hypothetical protein
MLYFISWHLLQNSNDADVDFDLFGYLAGGASNDIKDLSKFEGTKNHQFVI